MAAGLTGFAAEPPPEGDPPDHTVTIKVENGACVADPYDLTGVKEGDTVEFVNTAVTVNVTIPKGAFEQEETQFELGVPGSNTLTALSQVAREVPYLYTISCTLNDEVVASTPRLVIVK
jgi:plastocyanin